MNRYMLPMLGCLFLTLLSGDTSGELVREVNSVLSTHLIWKKLATICMMRDVAIKYKVRYNADIVCCPKVLLFSDQQYQRLIFKKALEIMKEDEIAEKTGQRVRQRIVPRHPNRKRRSTGVYLPHTNKNHSESSKHKETLFTASSVRHHNYFITNTKGELRTFDKNSRLTKEGIKHGFYHWRKHDSFPPKPHRLMKRNVPDSKTDITYTKVINKLYFAENSLMKNAETRLKQIYSCAQAKNTLTNILDPTQIVRLCPNAGISISSGGRTVKACAGTIKPAEQISLPNFTLTQSWFGHAETWEGNPKQSYWEQNTWHIALLNCPGRKPLNISYVIDFDVIEGLESDPKDPNYAEPLLKKECSDTVIPPYYPQDGIPVGGAKYIRSSLAFLISSLSFVSELSKF